MIIHKYTTSGGKDIILDYINHLPIREKIDGLTVLDLLEKGKLEELDIKPWQGKVWEIYFYKYNRIFYVIIENNDIYLLHACRKQKNKTEKPDSNVVKKRAKELEQITGKKIL